MIPATDPPPSRPDVYGPWQLDTLRRAKQLARRRGHTQVGMEHVALVLADADTAIVRHWRSLGIDDERARRELAPPGLPESPGYGRTHQFHAGVPDEIVVTQAVADFFRDCAQLAPDGTGRPSSAELASTVLTHLPAPLPGSPLLGPGPGVSPDRRGPVPAPAASGAPVQATNQQEQSALEGFGHDLTQLAAMGRLDPLIGRETEIEQVLRVLRRRTKRNPLLVGEPGVGKTAIVEGVACRIAAAELDGPLADARIVSVELAVMLADTRYRGEFEARVRDVVEEATSSERPTILFIDEFHLVARTGAAEGGLDLGSILLAPMARGQVAVIGATTPAEYRRHLRSAGPLVRRVQVIEITEPSPAEATEILLGLCPAYEHFHDVHIEPAAVQAAVRLARRGAGRLPDAALDLLDDACAQVRLRAAGAVAAPVSAEHVAQIAATRPRPGLLRRRRG